MDLEPRVKPGIICSNQDGPNLSMQRTPVSGCLGKTLEGYWRIDTPENQGDHVIGRMI
jgi:hypothetical protein